MVTATKVMRAARRSNQSPPPPAAPGGVTASARDAGVANQAPFLRCANSAASSPENSEPPPSPHPPQIERSERWSYDVDKKRRFKLCRIEECANRSVKGGVCYLHGAQPKLCEVEGCANRSKKGGVCHRHRAGRKLCEVEGCTNQSHIGGACYRHGAQPKLCEVEGCAYRRKKGGVCYRHRAGRKLCEVEGCTNQSHIGGACSRHGAQRKRKLCNVEGYTEQSYIGGTCSRHLARGSPCSVKGCVSQKKKGGMRDRHGATSRLCAFGGCANNICGNGGVFCNMHHRHFDLDLHGLATKEAAAGSIPGGERGPEEGRRTIPGRFGRGVHGRDDGDGGDDDAALATRTRLIIDAATAAANFANPASAAQRMTTLPANVVPTDPRLVSLLRMHRRTALSRAALRTIRAPREPSVDPEEARGGATTGAADRPPSAPPPERGEAAARRGETAAPGVLRFRRILRSLRRVGFADRLANIRALTSSGGDAAGAIQILLGRALTTVPSGVEDSEPGDGDHPSASATWRRRGGIHDEGVPEHDRECATTSRTRASLPDEQWFLYKLYAMLEYVVDTEHASAVSWINGGRAFAILDRVAFFEQVVPMFFRQTNFDSFTRQLNMWGFQRVLGKGPATAAWRHKRFVRGKMEGLQFIENVRTPGGEEESEPCDRDHPSALTALPHRGGIRKERIPEHDREFEAMEKTSKERVAKHRKLKRATEDGREQLLSRNRRDYQNFVARRKNRLEQLKDDIAVYEDKLCTHGIDISLLPELAVTLNKVASSPSKVQEKKKLLLPDEPRKMTSEELIEWEKEKFREQDRLRKAAKRAKEKEEIHALEWRLLAMQDLFRRSSSQFHTELTLAGEKKIMLPINSNDDKSLVSSKVTNANVGSSMKRAPSRVSDTSSNTFGAAKGDESSVAPIPVISSIIT